MFSFYISHCRYFISEINLQTFKLTSGTLPLPPTPGFCFTKSMKIWRIFPPVIFTSWRLHVTNNDNMCLFLQQGESKDPVMVRGLGTKRSIISCTLLWINVSSHKLLDLWSWKAFHWAKLQSMTSGVCCVQPVKFWLINVSRDSWLVLIARIQTNKSIYF